MRSTARPIRRLAAAAVVPLLVLTAAPAADADHRTRDRAQITVRASEHVVSPGEQVVLRGRMTTAHGTPAAGHRVKVQTGRVGAWHTLREAKVRTDERGRYRIRVVLHVAGVRDLRVVGVAPGPRKEAFEKVTLMVKRGG